MWVIKFLFFWLVLFCTVKADQELSPNYTINIPMRDGVELPTDIYLPQKNAIRSPCILVRNPAGRKTSPWIKLARLKKFGYVIAIQDTRNAIDQEGKTFPYITDGWGMLQDGYDTIEWLSKSSLTNGMIGTIGFSAAGITQLLLAPSAPPSLKCQYIGIAAGSMYHHGVYPGGQLLKNQVENWLGIHAKDSGVLSYVVNQPFYNDFWEHFDSLKVSSRVKVPAILYTGWYDTFLKGTLDAFEYRQNQGGVGAKGTQKLFIGPWTHFWPESKQLGDFEIPLKGRSPPFDFSPQRWFDYYLKGIPNGIERLPSVTYYVMGPLDGSPSSGNIWRTSENWPVPAKLTAFYLTADQKIEYNSPLEERAFTFEHNPFNPVPTIGGHNLFLDCGPKDQRPIENREDVIVFTTSPLEEDLEVTGEIFAKLFVSSNCKDTDVVVRLTDVYPDGRSILICDGIVRTGIESHLRPERNISDQPGEITIDLWATSIVFAKNHCIRISIAGSNFPRYENNLNIGLFGCHSGNYKIAQNTLYVGDRYPSCLVLPIVRKGNTWLSSQ